VPRIRTIKPSFFQSDDVSALPLRARLTWIGLWTQCDDQGRTKDHARLIKAAIWPLDNVSLADIEEDLTTLAEQGRIVRYMAAGQRYLEIVNWDAHQSINRPSPSRIPPPSVNGHGPLTEPSLGEGKGGEGKGGDARAQPREPPTPYPAGQEPPPRTCPKHPQGTDDPCNGCKQAREAFEAHAAEKRERIRLAAKCRVHRGELAHNCALCRAEELSPA
jgi:hypothetical protein